MTDGASNNVTLYQVDLEKQLVGKVYNVKRKVYDAKKRNCAFVEQNLDWFVRNQSNKYEVIKYICNDTFDITVRCNSVTAVLSEAKFFKLVNYEKELHVVLWNTETKDCMTMLSEKVYHSVEFYLETVSMEEKLQKLKQGLLNTFLITFLRQEL